MRDAVRSFAAWRTAAIAKWVLLTVAVAAYLLTRDMSGIDFLRDCDDHMRAAWLAYNMDQGVFPPASFFPRTGGAPGFHMHWTLPWNLVVLAINVIPAHFVGWHDAFFLTAPVVGPSMLGLLGLAVAWTVRPFTGRTGAIAGAIAACAGPVAMGYGMPGGMDHHVPATIVAIFALGVGLRAVMWRAHARTWAIAAGTLAALALWTAADTLPFVVVGMGLLSVGLALQECRAPLPISTKGISPAVSAALAAMIVSAAATAIDPPPSGIAILDLGRQSLLHPTLFALIGLTAVVGAALRRHHSHLPTSAAFSVSMWYGIALVAWVIMFPEVLKGLDSLPFPHELLVRIVEIRGADTPVRAFRYFAPIVPALVALPIFLRRCRHRSALILWLAAAGAFVVLVAFGGLHMRLGTYSQATGAVVFAPLYVRLRAWARATKRARPDKPRLVMSVRALPVLAILCIAAPHALMMFPAPPPSGAAAQAVVDREPTKGRCTISTVAAALDALLPADTLVFSDVGMSPKLLTETHLRTFAGLYHGYVDPMPRLALDVMQAKDVGADGAAHRILERYGVGAVLICPPAANWTGTIEPGSFAALVRDGTAPSWMERVEWPDGTEPTQLILYRIRS